MEPEAEQNEQNRHSSCHVRVHNLEGDIIIIQLMKKGGGYATEIHRRKIRDSFACPSRLSSWTPFQCMGLGGYPSHLQ